MHRSETIAQLAEAISKAQGAMKKATRDSENPYFKSKYADLGSVLDACRDELAANGLAVIQLPTFREGKVVLEYILLHSSGEWIGSELEMTPMKMDPQSIGSAITYARRYTLAPIAGVATEDDDGNAASGNSAKSERKTTTTHRDRTSTTIGPSEDEPTQPRDSDPPYISPAQQKRLWTIVRKRQWSDDDVKAVLRDFGVSSSKLIPSKDYERVCAIIENSDYAAYLDSRTNPTTAS